MKQRDSIEKFVGDQLSRWPLACENFRALKNVETRSFVIGGLEVRLQFNPARIASSAAKTDKASIAGRPCFLCSENRFKEQFNIGFEGRKGKKYDILLNPYPIFPCHLVIPSVQHTPQSISKRYVDILDMAKAYPDYTFFYNGPECGASAPDHHHFQAAPKGLMPLENDVEALLSDIPRDSRGNYIPPEDGGRDGAWADTLRYFCSLQDAHLYHYDRFVNGIFVLRSRTTKSAAKLFYRLLDAAPAPEGGSEPRFNMISSFRGGEYHTIVIFRTTHRSHHYFSEGPGHLTMSPGCADMAGVLIAPVREDFEKMTPELLSEMLGEVTLSEADEKRIIWKLSRCQAVLNVGIMSAPELRFEILHDGAGVQKATYREGKVDYNGALYDELLFDAATPSTVFASPSFVLYDVEIGKNFHWQRRETQKFAGSLRIIAVEKELVAINTVGVEDYLVSVISSEMKATASLEFLKAHAVISRSWGMAQIRSRDRKKPCTLPLDVANLPGLLTVLDGELAAKSSAKVDDGFVHLEKWYDHEDHKHFDVCADDHCQRYQGLTRAVGERVKRAVDETWGEVLTYDGEICDARFSKCCGGSSELFRTCWADEDKPYLKALPDTPGHDPKGECFCDTSDRTILGQILNDYDIESDDFFKWKVRIPESSLSELVMRKSGVVIGKIKGFVPLEAGPSGRIWKLRIEGSLKSLVVGKELEIRRVLSDSHLRSSAFEARLDGDDFVLEGRGWGHGVGLCQIGAAVMASKGFRYTEILQHYYPGSQIENE